MRNGRTALLALILAAGAACTRQETPAPAAPTEATPAPAPAPPASAPPLPQAAPREARIPSLAPDAARIRYRVYGSGEPAIVFIHGWSCDSGYWDAQLNHFAARHTVITVDLAGHGESATGKRGDWSPANFGADVAAAMLDVGPQRVVLVGSSMGGTVALEAARRLPGRVIGVVGVDTFRDIATPFPKELVDGLLASLRADFSKGITGFVGGNFFTERSDPILKRWIVEDMAAAPPEVAIPALEAYVGMDYGPLLAELDLPIVAVNAASSPTDEAATRALEPRFRAVALPDAGHFPMLEDPGAFNRVLDRIVAEWVAREPARKPLSADAPAG